MVPRIRTLTQMWTPSLTYSTSITSYMPKGHHRTLHLGVG